MQCAFRLYCCLACHAGWWQWVSRDRKGSSTLPEVGTTRERTQGEAKAKNTNIRHKLVNSLLCYSDTAVCVRQTCCCWEPTVGLYCSGGNRWWFMTLASGGVWDNARVAGCSSRLFCWGWRKDSWGEQEQAQQCGRQGERASSEALIWATLGRKANWGSAPPPSKTRDLAGVVETPLLGSDVLGICMQLNYFVCISIG